MPIDYNYSLNTLIKNDVKYRISKYRNIEISYGEQTGSILITNCTNFKYNIYLVLHMRRKLLASSFMPIIA